MLSKPRLNDMTSVSTGILLKKSHQQWNDTSVSNTDAYIPQTPFYGHGHHKNSARANGDNYAGFGTPRVPLSPGSQTISHTLCKPNVIKLYNFITES